MLTKCPECQLQVSTAALTCPHCGYPLKSNKVQQTRSKSNKHRRLPNGFGQISKMQNPNLRKPYRAMVTIGKNDEGRPICKLLKPAAYFKTYNEAYEALVEYNKDPYDLSPGVTMDELFDRWSKEHFQKLDPKSAESHIQAWKCCKNIKQMRVIDVRGRHLLGVLEDAPTLNAKRRMKSLLNLMFDYAVMYELASANYARQLKMNIKVQHKHHICFTDEEMQTLWSNINIPYVQLILIQCFSGFRPQELCSIKLENVNINEGYIVGGMKTQAGKDRIVPIHSKIKKFVEEEYKHSVEVGSKNLISVRSESKVDRAEMTYDQYRHRFDKIIRKLNINCEHSLHDCRSQFITMAKKAGCDEYAIKRIVGHTITDLTEETYTHRDIEWLRSEVEKI